MKGRGAGEVRVKAVVVKQEHLHINEQKEIWQRKCLYDRFACETGRYSCRAHAYFYSVIIIIIITCDGSSCSAAVIF